MDAENIFAATYSDWKVIKGRKVVQLVFELPLEKADEAYQVLGGMPIAAHEVWCGIARLKEGGGASEDCLRASETQPRPAAQKAGADKPKSPAQVAGYLCTVPAFRHFLGERYDSTWHGAWSEARDKSLTADIAAECVRRLCKVKSRSDLTDKNTEWNTLRLAYQLWLNEPDLEIAS